MALEKTMSSDSITVNLALTSYAQSFKVVAHPAISVPVGVRKTGQTPERLLPRNGDAREGVSD